MALPDLTKGCPRCGMSGLEPWLSQEDPPLPDPEDACTLCNGAFVIPINSTHAIEEAYAIANYALLQTLIAAVAEVKAVCDAILATQE